MKKYSLIAAVVAAAVASGAQAAQPSLAQAASPDGSLVIAGSSAAQKSIFNYIQNQQCDVAADALSVQSTNNTNFFAISCVMSNIGLGSGKLVTIYYRSEGGSVVGALPIVTGYHPYRLNLSACTQPGGVGTAVTCTVNGTSTAGTATSFNGPFDTWGGATTQDVVQLGVTDVEPAQLTGKDYPTNYNTGVWGTASATAMQGLTGIPVLQQVFGIAVNIPSADLTTSNGGKVNLSKEAVAGILNGKLNNWNIVPDATTGNPITNTSLPIVVINREPGSGTRTATNIYFYNYQCGAAGFISAGPTSLNYSTGDELSAAVAASGSIAYASIDNLEPNGTKYSALTMATINGVTPSTIAAAAGQYDFWFEANLVPNPTVTGSSATIATTIEGDIVDLANAPVAADINVIPGAGTNVAAIPFSTTATPPTEVSSGGVQIYINPFSRNGNSCNVPKTTL